MNDPSPLEAIFFAALEKGTPQERAAYLDEACAGDPELRRRIQKMLAAQDQAGSFLEKPAKSAVMTVDYPITEGPGSVIGPYKLLEQIGEGGFGVVFVAEQTQPVRRRVALKILKPGMDSRPIVARFEAERQALAIMDHPNIARVLDAGTTPPSPPYQGGAVGRPYFVMELVKGVPLTKYCDEHRLTPKERLELFVPVCQAIQHAHQKGIIHRDIKPSNVLVALYDGKPMPKVIDFGVAKATGQQLTEHTLVTGFGTIVGTLEYMSPEQAELNQLDIDTRSDIYALGVLLYELLAGTTPLDRKRLTSAAFTEMLRMIREVEPPKPSSRLSDSKHSLASISAQRQMEPAKLTKLVRGELDWIVMKALEKNRDRRYETASAFAADLERYLADEPVQACPPSAWYRFGKFARRNKIVLAMVAALALAVLVMVGSIGWIARDRSTRHAKLNEGILFALHDAGTARDLALSLTGNRSQWHASLAGAFAALKRAQDLAGQDQAAVDTALRKRLEGLLARLEADEADRGFVACLDELLAQLTVWDAHRSQFASDPAFPKLADAFNIFYGVELGTTPAPHVARRLQQRSRPIQEYLLAALHVCHAHVPEGSPQMRHWLGHVLELIDGDPWRARARQVLENSDWPNLEKMLKEVRVDRHPPALLHLLASQLPRDAWVTKMDVFLRIKENYPEELWASRFANALVYNLFAWVLVTTSDPEFRDEKRGLDLATQSVRLAPQDSDFWNTLGVAHYRVGNWSEAVKALQKAMETGNGGDGVDWLFLAMAHWHLGHKDEARKWYDQAVSRPEKSRLVAGILPRLRAEAAELLKVELNRN